MSIESNIKISRKKMELTQEIYNLFKENLPFVIRAEETAKNIINNSKNIVFEKRENNKLIACAIVNENTIILLCVDQSYKNRGIGSDLLKQCEKLIFDNGFDSVVLGAGFDYLVPGVPTSKKFTASVNENLNSQLNSYASDFFEKRGYVHSWGQCNCFDMCMPLSKTIEVDSQIGDEINGVLYRWAVLSDLNAITECVDDACQYGDESFSEYYRNETLYNEDSLQRVLVACKQEVIVGAVIVSIGVEKKDVGSVGCTSVCTSQTHKGIGTTLILLGTKFLQSLGLKNAFLGYTYSGLDFMYGKSGYEICTYYFMGRKTKS